MSRLPRYVPVDAAADQVLTIWDNVHAVTSSRVLQMVVDSMSGFLPPCLTESEFYDCWNQLCPSFYHGVHVLRCSLFRVLPERGLNCILFSFECELCIC